MLMVVGAFLPGFATQTEEELQAEMRQIEQRIQAQREVVAELRAQQASQEQLLPALDEEVQALEAMVAQLQQNLNSLNQSIAALNANIQRLNADITESERQIDALHEEAEARNEQIRELQQRLMERLRQQYMNGPVSNLQLLLSSSDLSSLLTVSDFIVRQAEADAWLRTGLEGEMARLRQLQEELREQQAVYEAQRLNLQRESATLVEEMLRQRDEQVRINSQVERLSATRAEIQGIIEGLQRNSTAAQEIIRREQQAYDEAQRQVNAIINQRMNAGELGGNVQNSGQMVWPFPHHGCRITSRFGASEPFRGGAVHRGVDISIANNWRTDWRVVAALCGVIADFGFNSSMGNYVVIYHGHFPPANGRIQTVYMHFHSFAPGMSRGMTVSAGQHIGMMGNTGHSTGPHLHFQVDLINANGSRTAVDPMRFVSGAPYLQR